MSKLGVLHFWILVHCSFCAGLATVFIWTAVTFWKDWMSTDNQRGQIESDSFLSMVPDSVARASDETAGHDLQNPVYTEFSFAPSTLEQSYPDVFQHEPGLHGMEGSQHDFSFHDLEGCSLPQHFQGEIAAETSDEPVSRSDSNRALFEARMSSMSDVELRVPWETGIMKQLLDRDDEIIFSNNSTCSATRSLDAFCDKRCRVFRAFGYVRKAHSWEPGTCGSVHAVVFFCNQSCA